MNWKVQIRGENPSDSSVKYLTDRTSHSLDNILMAFSSQEGLCIGGLSEAEAQEMADSLKRDTGISCRVLPDSDLQEESAPLYRVILVNYRPGYRTRLRRRLQELTRLPQEQVILWLSRMPFALSKGIDRDTALKIKKSVQEAGGIVRIETESMLLKGETGVRRSNAVFRRTTEEKPSGDSEIDDILFAKKITEEDTQSGIPPVTGLPEGYLLTPPPMDSYQTDKGMVVMHAPPKFVASPPSILEQTEYHWLPAVLPDTMDEVPQVLEFLPPPGPCRYAPPIVGSREHAPWAEEPSPEPVNLYPPPAGIDLRSLLPPILDEDSVESAESDQASLFKVDWDTINERVAALNQAGTLKLYLCKPAAQDEDKVAEALREVMGVSLRESWDLLRKSPVLLKEYTDHTLAILTVHRLEAKGVTVTLSRRVPKLDAGKMDRGLGLRAWLATNG